MSVPTAQARMTPPLQSAESDGVTLDDVVPLLYQELERIASRRLAREGSARTLQTRFLGSLGRSVTSDSTVPAGIAECERALGPPERDA